MSSAAKWWKCVPTAAADDWDENQGILNLLGVTGASPLVECYYTVQFTAISGTTVGLETPRRSLVTNTSIPWIDLIVPGKPYAAGKDPEKEFARAKAQSEAFNSDEKRERSRLLAL